MTRISHICMVIILLHITRAENGNKDAGRPESTNCQMKLDNFISETNEKLKNITEHFEKQLNDVHSRLDSIVKRFPKPKNCYAALKITHASGIHEILVPAFSAQPFEVFCDKETHNGGWTVIARRVDNSTDFYRNWTDYKSGFGDLRGDFFIGLDKLHAMTAGDRKQQLLIKLGDFNDIAKYAKYNEFEIGNETESYVLKTLGAYTGDAGDSLASHVGQKFTTKDRHNDDQNTEFNCAIKCNGAWWYKKCFQSHLFGPYIREGYGMAWLTFAKEWVNLKFVEMLIRPVVV